MLRDNIRRYGNKIRREDDETVILFDYEDYIMNNELYMIDIYNELGLNYNTDAESLKNITDLYTRLYFPKIKVDEVRNIIRYLNNDKTLEATKISGVYDTITRDLIMTNEIMGVVDDVRLNDDYTKIFKENYITQSIIHINLRIRAGKINMYRIFNEFETTDQYPFLQYQTVDGTIFFKFREQTIYQYVRNNNNNTEIVSKWFENTPYGISFKVRLNESETERFTTITLNENGKIEYKTVWLIDACSGKSKR